MTRDTPLPPGDATPRRTLSLKRETANAPRIEERLHKVLAQAGLGSRRALEERIATGQIKVNGEVAIVGSSIKTGDRVELDGKVFVASALADAPRMLIYHKPEGEVTTREDPEGRPTIFEKLPPLKGSRWIAVGRLDINTTGLLLLTTDGDLANALMHPSTEVRREYVCRIHGEVTDAHILQLQRGVELEDGVAKFDQIERIGSSDSHAWFGVALHEGRNREVRRMWEVLGFQVSRLKRVRYGQVELPRLLKRGQSEDVPQAEIEAMKASLNLPVTSAVLTLQPVIGQRRAKTNAFRPEPRDQRAWTSGGYADEGRELRAFDNLREDKPSRPGGKGRPKPGGAGARYGKPGGGARPNGGPRSAGAGGPPRGNAGGGARYGKPGGGAANPNIPDDIGNRIGGKPTHAGRKSSGPGYDNPAEHRSWYVPEGVTTVSRVAPPRTEGNRAPPYGNRANAGARAEARGEGRPGPGGPRQDGRSGGGYGRSNGPNGPGVPRPGGGAGKPNGRPGGPGRPNGAPGGGNARPGGERSERGPRPNGPRGAPGGPRSAQGPRGNGGGPPRGNAGGPPRGNGSGGRPNGGGQRPGGNNRPRSSGPKGNDGNR